MLFTWEGAAKVNNSAIKVLPFFRKKNVTVFFSLIKTNFLFFGWVGGWGGHKFYKDTVLLFFVKMSSTQVYHVYPVIIQDIYLYFRTVASLLVSQ